MQSGPNSIHDVVRRLWPGWRYACFLGSLFVVLLAAAVAGTLTLSSHEAKASEVVGTWESGGFAPFSTLECPHPSSQFQLVTSPVRQGSYAAKFGISGGDVWSNGTVRCLAAKYDSGETTGMDGYFHLSLNIPSPGISSNLIWELHHPSQLYNLNGCGVAPFAITTDGSKLQLRLETGDCKVGQNWTYRETVGIPSLSPYPKDTWIDVIVHIRFSEANDGLVELWSRTAGSSWPDSPEISRSGIPTMPFSSSTGVHNAQLYTEMGLYPGYSGYNGNDTIYLDDYRRESSLAAAKGENEQPAAAPAPAPAPAAAPAPAVTPEPTTPADNAAPTRQYMIEWGGRLFSTAGSFRSYLLGLGVDWPEFLKRHPAAVEQTGLISVQWDGEHFYDQASLVSQLDKQGVSYRSWAEDHPRAASVLAGRPVASAQRAPRVLQTKIAITWSGVAFTTADGLRTYLVRRHIDWNDFLVAHPAVAKRLAVASVQWDGKVFYSRRALSRWLVTHHNTFARWDTTHPGLADKLAP